MLNIQEFNQKLTNNQALLAIDFGLKKIGLAISDKMRKFASPLKVLANDGKLILEIRSVIQEYRIGGIIIGKPLNLDGSDTQNFGPISKFYEQLTQEFGIPIYFQDERFSSKSADKMLASLNVKRKERNKIDDQYSAYYILESFLASSRNCL